VGTFQPADIGQVECTNDIGSDSSLLVVFTPVHVRSSCLTSTVESVRWLVLFDLTEHGFSVFETRSGSFDLLALSLEHLNQSATDPSSRSKDEYSVLL